MEEHNNFMREAIRLSIENVKSGNGGPFGAVIVKNGEINLLISKAYQIRITFIKT